MTRHRRMRNNEQFYIDGCGIMIDGDVGIRLHYRRGDHDLADTHTRSFGDFVCFMVRFTRFPPQQRGLACIEFASREEQNIRCIPVDGPGVGAGDNPPGAFALSRLTAFPQSLDRRYLVPTPPQ